MSLEYARCSVCEKTYWLSDGFHRCPPAWAVILKDDYDYRVSRNKFDPHAGDFMKYYAESEDKAAVVAAIATDAGEYHLYRGETYEFIVFPYGGNFQDARMFSVSARLEPEFYTDEVAFSGLAAT